MKKPMGSLKIKKWLYKGEFSGKAETVGDVVYEAGVMLDKCEAHEIVGQNLFHVDTDSMEMTEDVISFKLKGVRTHAFGPALDRMGRHDVGSRAGRTFSVGEDCICIYGGDRPNNGVYKVVATKNGAHGVQVLTLSGNGRRFQMGNHFCLKMNRKNLLDEIVNVLDSYYAVATCCSILPPTNVSKSEQDRIRAEYRAEELPKWRKAAKGLIHEFRSRWPKAR